MPENTEDEGNLLNGRRGKVYDGTGKGKKEKTVKMEHDRHADHMLVSAADAAFYYHDLYCQRKDQQAAYADDRNISRSGNRYLSDPVN